MVKYVRVVAFPPLQAIHSNETHGYTRILKDTTNIVVRQAVFWIEEIKIIAWVLQINKVIVLRRRIWLVKHNFLDNLTILFMTCLPSCR